MQKLRSVALLVVAFLLFTSALPGVWADDQVVSPESHLGRDVGADFQLVTWPVVQDYYQKLADASDRVDLQVVGETTEGRDFCIAVISAAENLKNIDQIRQRSKVLADPRGHAPEEIQDAIQNGKVIVFVTLTMHSNEPAATEMGMQLAYDLATGTEEIWEQTRQSAVVVIVPSLNPDGVDLVSEWYHQHVGTPLEGTSLPRLYQYYTGHDNNRDFFSLTQPESRMLTRLMYHEWFPQILWDVHQASAIRERFFVPPYRDPLNPNIPPAIVAGTNLLGTRAVMDLTKAGLTGVACGVSYDNWWNGGNRSVPCRHNIIGILTEAASANLASPRFLQLSDLSDPLDRDTYSASNQFITPWQGGWWRLKDIIKYELTFARSLFGSVSREPKFWLQNGYDSAQYAIEQGREGGPRGWLITTDNQDLGAVARILDILLLSGVEVKVASAEFTADERIYPAGTIVLLRDQPYGNLIKDLFELKDFPSDSKPYDVTGWSLPHLLGVRRVEFEHDVDIPATVVQTVAESMQAFQGDPRIAGAAAGTMSITDSRSWTELTQALKSGESRHLVVAGPQAGLWLTDEQKAGSEKQIETISLRKMPRIGVYSPRVAQADEGWLRWMFDELKIPFRNLRSETLRAGHIHDLVDVLIIPSLSAKILEHGRQDIEPAFRGGLEVEGMLAIQEFVQNGGKLITAGESSAWAIELFQLPLIDVTRSPSAKEFSCTGSVLRGTLEENPILAGAPTNFSLFFDKSSAFQEKDSEDREKKKGPQTSSLTSMMKYSTRPVLLSGNIVQPETIEGQTAWSQAQVGQGTIHLFGFRPYYRGWSHGTFHLLLRAAFLTSPPASEVR